MKKHATWSYAPYKPLFIETGDIYICRIVPYDISIHFEWLPLEEADKYSVFYRKRETNEFIAAGETAECSFEIPGLENETDYEFYVECAEKKSRIRLAKTGACFFGSVINYLHPDDTVYEFSGYSLCSPSFVRLPDGAIVASMDVFKGQYPQNLTLIYRSEDNGKTWKYACELFPCFWGRLFVHRGELYMLSCSTEYGDFLIGKSVDGGRTFSLPTVLFYGGGGKNGEAGMHRAPMPVLEYDGRIWTPVEWGNWGRKYHAAMVASAPVDADLLDADSWCFTEPLKYDPEWPGVAKGFSVGCIEGCPVVGPDGKLYNIMRYQMTMTEPNYGLALVYSVNTEDPEASITYERAMEFPANHSKFEIRYDEKGGYYYSLGSYILDKDHTGDRNILSLLRSKDLYKWEVVKHVLDKREEDPNKLGFQYVTMEIDGDDILYHTRTSLNGAANFHDANFSVFDKIENFRDILK